MRAPVMGWVVTFQGQVSHLLFFIYLFIIIIIIIILHRVAQKWKDKTQKSLLELSEFP